MGKAAKKQLIVYLHLMNLFYYMHKIQQQKSFGVGNR